MQHKQSTALLTAFVVGVAGTIQYHSAQFLSGFDTFFGDRGDVRGFAYFCEHWYQWFLGKSSLLSPAIFYPTERTLAYSDTLFGIAVPYSLFRGLGFSMFSSVEIVIILATFLGYCAAFFLLYRTLRFGLVPSCAGAMFFAFSSPKFFQTIHLQLQFVVLLPVIFALAITFAKQVETITQRRAALLLSLVGVCLDVQLATAFYFAWFFVLWAIVFLTLSLAFSRTRHFLVAVAKKFWRALLAAAATFLLVFIPIFLLYLPAIKLGSRFEYDFVSQMIPDWRALLSIGTGNYVWGKYWISPTLNPPVDTWGELQIGIGLIPSLVWIALTVSIISLVKRRNTPPTNPGARQLGPLFLALLILSTTIFYLIGFKYSGHSPWFYIYQYFPGGGAIRAVARYVIFLTLPMSIAFAYFIDKGLDYAACQQDQNRRRALAISILVLAALGVFEQFGTNKFGSPGFSKRIEESYLKAMASRLTSDCQAFYVAAPHGTHSTAEYQYDAMLVSILSRIPTINASSSQFPRDWNMYFVKNPDYENNVKQWIDSHRISRKVCRLEITPEVETFDLRAPSPVDDPKFFVSQLYRDFTGKEPDVEVVMRQLDKLRNCHSGDASCERAQIALNIFLSTGFHERGSFILRMYDAGLGRAPSYMEFTEAMRSLSEYPIDEPLTVAAERMLTQFIQSPEFKQRANGESESAHEQAFRQLVNSDEVIHRLDNRSFVMLHYYGYLGREPEPQQVAGWVNVLERSGDSARVTEGFITSVEYRQRFRN